ncbi:hypothetical protein PFISCL1PPCAC_18400, partial [Pristionchus fissidentatus]
PASVGSNADSAIANYFPSSFDLDCALQLVKFEIKRGKTVPKNFPLSRKLSRHLMVAKAVGVVRQEDLIRAREE